jgi:hypothetical protein
MSTGVIVGIVIAVIVVLALAAFLAWQELRRRQLRQRFGPEYDRIREDQPKRRAIVQELTERERRHAEFGIKPISPMSRERHARHWELIQATFVDQPSKAVDEADRLVVSIMDERGYPRAGFDERLSMLSVEHGSVLHHYRAGHDIRGRHAESQLSTEDLRVAMVHYRSLIEDLLEVKPQTIRPKLELAASRPADNGREAPELPAAPANGRDREVLPEPEDHEPEIIESRPIADTSMRPDAETHRV